MDKDKCFEEKNLCRVCQETRKVGRQGRLTEQNEAWNVSTDFDLWLERRAELGNVYCRAELQTKYKLYN